MITNEGFKFLTESIKNEISIPQALVNGKWENGIIQDIEITQTALKIKCYFDEEVKGVITNYRVMLKNGNTLLIKNDTIEKDDSRGLLVLFEIEIKEGEL